LQFLRTLAAAAVLGWFAGAIPVQGAAPVTAAEIEHSGVRIHYEDGGSGPGLPVLFVHGLAGDSEMWRAQVDHVRRTRRGVLLDLRGHGRSGLASGGDYSMPAMASDVLAVADALGLKRFVLVGHSMGGAVVLAASAAAPDRVAALLFADPAGDVSRLPEDRLQSMVNKMSGPSYADFMKGWFGVNLENGKEATRALVMRDLEKTPPEVVRACYLGLAAYQPKPALEAFRGPMLTVVLPGSDRASSYQNLVPGLTAVKVKDLSHWLMMDDPALFDGIMETFLARIK
jgi:pimeloyl-ACP methyl ester carboxylesterase